MKKPITRLLTCVTAALVAVALFAPVNVSAVVKNVQIISDGKAQAGLKVTLTSPSGKKYTQTAAGDDIETDENGVLIWDFNEDGNWTIEWAGGSMVVKAGGGIGPYIVVPAVVGVTAAIIKAADSDNDDDSSYSQPPGGGSPISGSYQMATFNITFNPNNHPQFFTLCTYVVTESSGSLTIDCDQSTTISVVASGSVDGSNNFTATGTGTYASVPGTEFQFSGSFDPMAGTWQGTAAAGTNGSLPGGTPIEGDFTGPQN